MQIAYVVLIRWKYFSQEIKLLKCHSNSIGLKQFEYLDASYLFPVF